jgi:hypothetical protein
MAESSDDPPPACSAFEGFPSSSSSPLPAPSSSPFPSPSPIFADDGLSSVGAQGRGFAALRFNASASDASTSFCPEDVSASSSLENVTTEQPAGSSNAKGKQRGPDSPDPSAYSSHEGDSGSATGGEPPSLSSTVKGKQPATVKSLAFDLLRGVTDEETISDEQLEELCIPILELISLDEENYQPRMKTIWIFRFLLAKFKETYLGEPPNDSEQEVINMFKTFKLQFDGCIASVYQNLHEHEKSSPGAATPRGRSPVRWPTSSGQPSPAAPLRIPSQAFGATPNREGEWQDYDPAQYYDPIDYEEREEDEEMVEAGASGAGRADEEMEEDEDHFMFDDDVDDHEAGRGQDEEYGSGGE